MLTRADLAKWLVEAMRANGGRATIIEASKYIWQNYEQDIRASGDMLYTWQYETRWAANILRGQGIMKKAVSSPKGIWELES